MFVNVSLLFFEFTPCYSVFLPNLQIPKQILRWGWLLMLSRNYEESPLFPASLTVSEVMSVRAMQVLDYSLSPQHLDNRAGY